ncbi:hypothetical protein SUGI_0867550, partial [Cryptomeria japonica]
YKKTPLEHGMPCESFQYLDIKNYDGVYTSGPPLTYSVKANARRPSIAKRPFHISAVDENIGCDVLSLDIPLNRGTSVPIIDNPAINAKHDTPPLFTCDNVLLKTSLSSLFRSIL